MVKKDTRTAELKEEPKPATPADVRLAAQIPGELRNRIRVKDVYQHGSLMMRPGRVYRVTDAVKTAVDQAGKLGSVEVD